MDKRPCEGRSSNICVAEGCYGEACLRISNDEKPVKRPNPDAYAKFCEFLSVLAIVVCILVVLGIFGGLLFVLVVP